MPGLRDLTPEQRAELRILLKSKGELNPYTITQPYLIRTTSNIFIGRCTMASAVDIELAPAVWLVNTVIYRSLVAGGSPTAADIERITGPVILGRSQILDAIEWRRALP